MTTVVVLAADPREGGPLADLLEAGLDPAHGARLYRALLGDIFGVLARSTVEILINYPSEESLEPLREIAAEAMPADRYEAVRFEPQVGSDRSAIAGNAITHLLREEGTQSAAVLDPRAPLLERSIVDEVALKVRRSDVVLGPSGSGVFLAAFAEPIDFTDVFEGPALSAIAERAEEEGLTIDFARTRRIVDTPADLAVVAERIRSRLLAEKPVPHRFTRALAETPLEIGGHRIDLEGGGE
ncbi:MAG: hypothetical protein ACOCY6_04805 [Halodesulfurarchaeum sp.]